MIKNFCLLGFSQATEELIKKYISTHASTFTLHWVAANNPSLDGVVINALFLHSPQVKKFLSIARCPCLCAYSGQTAAEAAAHSNLPALNLDDLSANGTVWLTHLLTQTAEKKTISAAANPTLQTTTHKQASRDYKALIEQTHNPHIPMILACNGQKQSWISPAEQAVYINFSRNQISAVEKWAFNEVAPNELPKGLRKLKLDQWLFETLWHSNIKDFEIRHNRFYQLLRWPQPFSPKGRTEVLRLAAQLKIKPLRYGDLISSTSTPDYIVEQFLYAASKSHHIKLLEDHELPKEQTPQVAKPDPDKEVKRSLISRLRKKLFQ